MNQRTQTAAERSSGLAEVNGTRLWFEDGGDGPPIVLIHGSPLDARIWFRFVQPQPAMTGQVERMIGDYSGWHWHNADPVVAPRPAAYERLEAIAAPALVIVGEHDHPDIHAAAAALATRMPASRSLTIRDAGHMVKVEQPEQFNQAVLAFLAGCEVQTETAASNGPPVA